MFQKVFAIAAENKISCKDKKKLRKSFQRLYPRLTEEDLDSLLPLKSEAFTFAKLKSPHRGVLYLEEGIPILLDTSGKGDLVPTLAVLWKFPHLIPRISVKHSAVSKFILNGADLMLPGVLTPFEGGFLHGTLVSICIPGNAVPFAFGFASMSSTQAMQSVRNEGRLVQIVQSYGDLFTRHFSNLEPPNSGFTRTLISPIDEVDGPSTTTRDLSKGAKEESEDEDSSNEEIDKDLTNKEVDEELNTNEEVDVDQLLIECFFQALHKSVRDQNLPLPAGELWIKHMCPFRPPGSSFNARQSSYKKLSKFLQQFTSKTQPLLTLRIDKFSNEPVITSINRRHEDYLSFQPRQQQQNLNKVQHQLQQSSENTSKAELKIEEVYRMGRELNQVLSALHLEPGSVLSKTQAGEVVFEYVKIAGLDQGVPDSQHIVLDRVLGEALFRGRLKKNEKIPEYVPKSQLREIAFTRMHPQFRITRGQQEVLKKGNIQPVHVVEEKRTGNKHVTRISGLQGFLIDVQETSLELKKKFACSTSLNEVFHKGVKEKEIILQGKQAKQITQFIERDLKIPKQFTKSK